TYQIAVSTDYKCGLSDVQVAPLQSFPSVTGTSTKLASLGTGYYYLCAKAVDAAGNTTFASNNGAPFQIDVDPPTVGQFLAPPDVTFTSFTLNWTMASDAFSSPSMLAYLLCSGTSPTAIDTVAKCEAATVEMPYTTYRSSFEIDGKAPGARYYYNLVVR